MGVLDILGIAFIILKLCHVIDWNWGFVLLPFIIPLTIVAVLKIVGDK